MINYQYLTQAMTLYQKASYSYMDVPWWATKDIMGITKPEHLPSDNEYMLSLNGKCLIASGEQGFLYLANKGHLATGQYQTITPCFRNEQHDMYHQKQFMKLELIRFYGVDQPRPSLDTLISELHQMREHAMHVFQTLGPQLKIQAIETIVNDPATVPNTPSYDIEAQGGETWIELGSYGIRQSVFGCWIYGTGLAEPRFSKVLAAASNSR